MGCAAWRASRSRKPLLPGQCKWGTLPGRGHKTDSDDQGCGCAAASLYLGFAKITFYKELTHEYEQETPAYHAGLLPATNHRIGAGRFLQDSNPPGPRGGI